MEYLSVFAVFESNTFSISPYKRSLDLFIRFQMQFQCCNFHREVYFRIPYAKITIEIFSKVNKNILEHGSNDFGSANWLAYCWIIYANSLAYLVHFQSVSFSIFITFYTEMFRCKSIFLISLRIAQNKPRRRVKVYNEKIVLTQWP